MKFIPVTGHFRRFSSDWSSDKFTQEEFDELLTKIGPYVKTKDKGKINRLIQKITIAFKKLKFLKIVIISIDETAEGFHFCFEDEDSVLIMNTIIYVISDISDNNTVFTYLNFNLETRNFTCKWLANSVWKNSHYNQNNE